MHGTNEKIEAIKAIKVIKEYDLPATNKAASARHTGEPCLTTGWS